MISIFLFLKLPFFVFSAKTPEKSDFSESFVSLFFEISDFNDRGEEISKIDIMVC